MIVAQHEHTITHNSNNVLYHIQSIYAGGQSKRGYCSFKRCQRLCKKSTVLSEVRRVLQEAGIRINMELLMALTRANGMRHSLTLRILLLGADSGK